MFNYDAFESLEKVDSRTYRLQSKDSTTYMTFPIDMYFDMYSGVLYEADIRQVVERTYQKKLKELADECVENIEYILGESFPNYKWNDWFDWYPKLVQMKLCDWNLEADELVLITSQLRYVGELLSYRVNFVINVHHRLELFQEQL